MSDKDNPFAFVDWEHDAISDVVPEGPFQTALVQASHEEWPPLQLLSKDLYRDLALPEVVDLPPYDLEDISDLSPSSDSERGLQDKKHDHGPWTLPDCLTLNHEPSLTTFAVNVLQPASTNHALESSVPRVTADTFSNRGTDGVLIIDPKFFMTCLCYMAQAQSSPLFWPDAGNGVFQAVEQGRFCVPQLKDEALRNLMVGCKAVGEKHLRIENHIDSIIGRVDALKTHVAIAAAVRNLLEADCARATRELSSKTGFAQLHASLRKTDALLDMLWTITKSEGGLLDETQVLRAVLTTLVNLEVDNVRFKNSLKAITLSVATPALEQLFGRLGLRTEGELDEDLLQVLLESTSNSCESKSGYNIATEDERQLIQHTLHGMDTLRLAVPGHPLLSAADHAYLQEVAVDCLFDTSLDLMSQKHQLPGAGVTNDLHNASGLDTSPGSAFHPLDPDRANRYSAAFEQLATKIVTPPAQPRIGDHRFATALEADFSVWEQGAQSTATQTQSLLAPLRPLLESRSRLVAEAVLHMVFDEQKLLLHLDLQRQFQLFGNGVFLRRLQTALFDSSSASPRDRLKVEGNFGLRMDGRASRWPPASSDLQLTLAGLLSDSYTDPSPATDTSKDLPGGLSFAVRTLSEDEIATVLDASSPHALDFLRLQYSPPADLAAFFTTAIVDKYDDVFRFLLSLVRQSHLTKTLLHLLTTRPRSPAHAFAYQAHYTVSVLTTHMFDLGITAPWNEMVDSLLDAEDALIEGAAELPQIASLVELHATTLCTIHDRLFLSDSGSLSAPLQTLFATVLRAAAVLTTGTQSLAADSAELKDDTRNLGVQLRTAVTELIAACYTRNTEYHRLLALSLEGGGFFTTHADTDWCSL